MLGTEVRYWGGTPATRGACLRGERNLQSGKGVSSPGFPPGREEDGPLQLDDHLKQLLRELGHAINDTVSESERISTAISNVRTAGYDIVLKLDATIGLARRDAQPTRITTQDRRFLESLHIQVDEEIMEEGGHVTRLEMTPQDIRFLKSLKISLDESE